MNRRKALHLLAALPLLGATCSRQGRKTMTNSTMSTNQNSIVRMPVVFAAHGAPILLDDQTWVGELAAWGKSMPRPKSILMISAHWEERPATLGATSPAPLVYDFSGFPEKYYQM
jgi:aromatic ring-opening dioxygenase catalytic subunit (LigB family)